MSQQQERASWRFETLSVHGGYSPDPTTHAVAVPIYQHVNGNQLVAPVQGTVRMSYSF